MNLSDYHCDSADLAFQFAKEDFDKAAFLAELKIENESELVDEDGDQVISLGLPSRAEPPATHAHLVVVLPRDEPNGRVAVDFHETGPKKPDVERPTYLEDIGPWLSQFFKKEINSVRASAWFAFEKDFETVIPLPFPLVVSNKKLAGLRVKGLSLEFPEDALVEDAILQYGEEGDKFLFLGTKPVWPLKTFDLKTTLDRLNETVSILVKEKANGDARQQTED